MPMPIEYAHASEVFEAFLAEVKEQLDHATRNMAYTTVQSVLLVFRRRLTPEETIAFAAVLPVVLRAIFVSDWDLTKERQPFASLDALNVEVKSVRHHHNFSPDNAIQTVAKVLRRHVDAQQFDRVLREISPEAHAYWAAE